MHTTRRWQRLATWLAVLPPTTLLASVASRECTSFAAWRPHWRRYGVKIAVMLGAAINVEVYARGLDNALWENYWSPATSNWSGWHSLGGTLP
jgi:hypothetical protein